MWLCCYNSYLSINTCGWVVVDINSHVRLEHIPVGEASSCKIICAHATTFTCRSVYSTKILHLSPNNYRGNTPSAGEDASGTLSDALLHEARCLSFIKKAKIERQQTSRFRAQELVFAGLEDFLLPWDHTGTQNCLSALFSNFTVDVLYTLLRFTISLLGKCLLFSLSFVSAVATSPEGACLTISVV